MRKRPELTEEQRIVVEAPLSGSLVVTAAAGSGKTFVLTERYLRHIREDGLSPDQILTITFTKKAAYEMKRRIVSALREAGRVEEAQIAETGPIQTIHSFCERLLRENALEAGLDPEFEIDDVRTDGLLTEAVRYAISRRYEEDSPVEKLLRLLVGRSEGFSGGGSPYAFLESAVRRTLVELRSSGQNTETLEGLYEDASATLRHWQSVLLDSLPGKIREHLPAPSGQGFPERVQEAFRAAGVRRPPWLNGVLDPELDQTAAEQAAGLVRLAIDSWHRYERLMLKSQTLDFVELEARAVRLLHSSEATLERVRTQYKVRMVDESQDLNPLQHRLLEGLALEGEMMVGDEQQSIYGFRQADVALFRAKTSTEAARRLSVNRRSAPGILRFIDTLFASLWNEYRPMAHSEHFDFELAPSEGYAGVEIWLCQDRDSAFVARHVRDLIEEGERPNEIALLVRTSGYAMQLQTALEKVGVRARIAGGAEQFYARLEIRDLANALRACADPYDDFSLLATLRSPFAGLSLDAIGLLAKEAPLFEALPHFEAPTESDRYKLAVFNAWFLPLTRGADRVPAWETISALFAKSPFLEELAGRPNGEQLLANVRKLLALAAGAPHLGPLEYAEQIREIQSLRHKEGDAPIHEEEDEAVTLMTVHKAKGLEFETVILPEQYRPLSMGSRPLEIEPREALLSVHFEDQPSLYHRWMAESRKEREREEELRVAYVALTRAKKRLCVLAHPGARDASLAKLIARTFGLERGAPPGVFVREGFPSAREDSGL